MNLQELLGIDLPIVQAPMAGVQDTVLPAAVSEAGGLGSLACALLDDDGVQTEVAALAAKTSRPYNVNFFCHQTPGPDAQREAAWRAALEPYYEELGIDPDGIAPGAGRAPFGAGAADVLESVKPAVVSFHFGLPPDDLFARVKSWGSTILCSATTVEEAVWLESRGVDAVIAQGVEAGGHRGIFMSTDLTTQVGTLALVPQIVRSVSIPVIAAGGISDAAGVRAAMALGAAGVQVGTAFLLCPEATTSAVHRAALKTTPAARHTALTNVFTGRPARGIVNRIIRELGPISSAAPAFPLATAGIAPLRARAEAQGSGDFSPLWSGQNASGCQESPAATIVHALAAGLNASDVSGP